MFYPPRIRVTEGRWGRSCSVCVMTIHPLIRTTHKPFILILPLLAVFGPSRAWGQIFSLPSEDRGHVIVIDEIRTEEERFITIGDAIKQGRVNPRKGLEYSEHGYLVAQAAREHCLACAITLLDISKALFSRRLEQALDFVNRHPRAQVLIVLSVAYPKGPLVSDIPKSDAMMDQLVATGRVVIAVATQNNIGTDHVFAYPADSSKVTTIGALTHPGTFATKVDVVTKEYDLQGFGVYMEGNSFAAPQLALVARIVMDNKQLSIQDALSVVLRTTDLEWHKYSKQYVRVINETKASERAKELNDERAGQK